MFLVKHNSKYYALKCLSKALVMETGLQVFALHSCHYTDVTHCTSMLCMTLFSRQQSLTS